MGKFLPGLIIFLMLTGLCPAGFAAEEDGDKEAEKKPLFQNLDDETTKLNQEFSNNPVYSPFNAPFAQGRFVPDIAFIMDFSYAQRNYNNVNFEALSTPGFNSSGGHQHGRLHGHNGFNFNYGELALASSVDPYFDLFTNFHLAEFAFEIEEAFINTRSIPYGFQFKIGKFLSSFGRTNSLHAHAWDFADQNLVYDNLFGQHGILEKGIQVNWVAPLDSYLMAGLEILSGENEKSFGTTGFQSGQFKLEEVNTPNLLTAFVKSSVDLDDLILLGGLSFATGGTRTGQAAEAESDLHLHAETAAEPSFAGGARIFGADFTAKYFIDSYRYLSWQTEFLHRSTAGSEYNLNSRNLLAKEQSGLYSQLIWKFNQQWRVGARFDLMARNDISRDNTSQPNPANLARYTAMLDFNPTEFSRIRLQFNHDKSKFSDNKEQGLNEIFLQLNMAVGAHGAHQF